MASVIIKISGMSCGGCVKSISGKLALLPGVSWSEVSLEQAHATVEFDPARVSRQQLADVIESAGFGIEQTLGQGR